VEKLENLSWQEKIRLIKGDPVTCARYFDHRFKEMWKLVTHENSIFRGGKQALPQWRVHLTRNYCAIGRNASAMAAILAQWLQCAMASILAQWPQCSRNGCNTRAIVAILAQWTSMSVR